MTVFAEWARKRSAAFVLAPEKYTDPLVNTGGWPLLAPTLMNGAGLIPGLVRGHAAVALDGSNDYIESGWGTRVNRIPTPSPEPEGGIGAWGTAGGFWNNAGAAAVRSALGAEGLAAIPGLTMCLQITTPGTSAAEGARQEGINVVKGVTYRISAYLKGASTGGQKVRIAFGNSTVGTAFSDLTLTNTWQRYSFAFTATESGAAAFACAVPLGSTLAQQWWVTGCLMEEGATLSEYTPQVAQVQNGEAGFSGTSWASTSFLGAFANGTTRSFFGVARRGNTETADVLFGSSGTGETTTVLRAVAGNNNILFSVNGNTNRVEWANALPGAETIFSWALVFNETTNAAELFINGASLGSKELPQQYSFAAGTLQIGVTGSGGNPWIGAQLPFVAFIGALSAEDISIGHETLAFEAAVAPLVAVKANPQSGRLAFYAKRIDGTMKRLAGDEPEAEDIARNFVFGTSVPGGYGTASLDLTRDPRIEYGDFDLYDEFIAKGPGNESAFEGYNIEIPNSDDQQVGLSSTGWASSLKDNPSFQEIYVDRDLSRWGTASAARKITLIGASFTPYDPTILIDPGSGLPAIELGWEGSWVSPWKPRGEAWYDAGPTARIAKVIFSWALIGAGGATPWNLFIVSQPTDNSGSEEISADLRDTVGDSGSATFSPAAKNRYARFRFEYEGTPAGSDGQPFKCHVRGVVIVGNHSVPLTASNGVLASDVVADIISRAAPLLTYTTGNEGSIQPSVYSMPHLIYPEAVTAEDAILQASKYDVPDWGVYDNREFFWRPPTTGRLWVARQGDSGTTLKDAGKQAEDVFTGVMVQFTDPSGKTFLVGPPGTSGCDYTDASLQDTSETNVLNEHGRARLGKIVVGATTTLSGAIQIGARWLQEELAVSDRGTAQLTSFVQDSSGNWEPVWKVRAGDRIRFDDADGRERRIIETTYNHEERTNSLTLDSTPHRVEALMEKMQVELVAIGAGS